MPFVAVDTEGRTTGRIEQIWLQLLITLWKRTGGSIGESPLESLLLEAFGNENAQNVMEFLAGVLLVQEQNQGASAAPGGLDVSSQLPLLSDPMPLDPTLLLLVPPAAAGEFSGPFTATDNAVARFNGTSGWVVQNSRVTIDDAGVTTVNISTPGAGVTPHTTSAIVAQKNDSVGLQLAAPDDRACEVNFGFPTGGATRHRIYAGGSTYVDGDNFFFQVASAVRAIMSSTGFGVGPAITAITASCVLECQSTTGAFLPPTMTSAQRDALTPTFGMIIANSTTGTVQRYQGGAWGDL